MCASQLGKRSIKDVVNALQRMDLEELGGLDVLQSLYSLNDYSHVFGRAPCAMVLARGVTSLVGLPSVCSCVDCDS